MFSLEKQFFALLCGNSCVAETLPFCHLACRPFDIGKPIKVVFFFFFFYFNWGSRPSGHLTPSLWPCQHTFVYECFYGDGSIVFLRGLSSANGAVKHRPRGHAWPDHYSDGTARTSCLSLKTSGQEVLRQMELGMHSRGGRLFSSCRGSLDSLPDIMKYWPRKFFFQFIKRKTPDHVCS